jgi:hypothetical protein
MGVDPAIDFRIARELPTALPTVPEPPDPDDDAPPDERLVLLQRAAARARLVEASAMPLDEAFDDLLGPFLEIVFPRPENPGEAHWHSPGWAAAAIEYRRDREQRERHQRGRW